MLSTFHTRVDKRSIRHFCIVFTPNLPLPLRRSPPKSNTPLPSPTPLTTPNDIPIYSRVSPLLTCADRQMAQAKVLSHKRFALWSDALKISQWQLFLNLNGLWQYRRRQTWPFKMRDGQTKSVECFHSHFSYFICNLCIYDVCAKYSNQFYKILCITTQHDYEMCNCHNTGLFDYTCTGCSKKRTPWFIFTITSVNMDRF